MGNARELENLVERAVLLCGGREITPDHMPPALRGSDVRIHEPLRSGERKPLKEMLNAFEASCITQALTDNGGNRTQTARALGISRKHLWTKIQRLGIDVPGDPVS